MKPGVSIASSPGEGFNAKAKSYTDHFGKSITEFLVILKEIVEDSSKEAHAEDPFPSEPTVDN